MTAPEADIDMMGDDQEVPCPWCRKTVCIGDLSIDGVLKPGYVTDCPDCKRDFVITEVSYDVTVFVGRHVGGVQ